MSRKFRGEYTFKVDAKGRVSIPAPFRRLIERGDPDYTEGLRPQFMLVYGDEDQKFIEGYTMVAAQALEDRIALLPSSGLKRQMIMNNITRSHGAEIDPDGRLVLPARLREKIGLDKEAVLAGTFDTFKIWSPEAYRDFAEEDDEGLDPDRPLMDQMDELLKPIEGI